MEYSFNQFLILFSISILLWSARVHSTRRPTSPSMRQRYHQWITEHNKIYSNEIEREDRFQIFKENVKYIDAFNAAGNNSYTLGLNQFTDLTDQERVARFTGARPHLPARLWNASAANHESENLDLDGLRLPRTWDWRKLKAITPVKKQTCGNCWAFAGVAAVESVNYIGTGKLNVLSEQEIMDCNLPGRGGCDGGWEQEVYEYVKRNSLTTEANYPNKPQAGACDVSKKNRARVARVSSFVIMRSYITDIELMQAVVKRPLVVGIDASSPGIAGYKSGVFNGPCGSTMNHVMQLVGYGETGGMKHWIARNSWGSGWGEGGYIKIQMGTGRMEGVCGVNLRPSYPVY